MATKNTYLLEIKKILDEGRDIVSLPQIIVKVQEVTQSDSTSARELAGVIMDDPSLTGKVLKLANSAFYKRTNKEISTVTNAIVLLGFSVIQEMVMSISAYEILGMMVKKDGYRSMWKHSLCTAVCSKSLAEAGSVINSELAFVSGLLHDIGKFILGQYFPEEYQKVLEKVEKEGVSYHKVEQEIFGCDHLEVGLLLAKYWNLPEKIQDVIRNHEYKSLQVLRRETDTTKIVCISNLVANKIYGLPAIQEKYSLTKIIAMAENILEIDSDSVVEILSRLGGDVYQVASLLDFAIDEFKMDLKKQSDRKQKKRMSGRGGDLDRSPQTLLDFTLNFQEQANHEKDLKKFCDQNLILLQELFELKNVIVFIINSEGRFMPSYIIGENSQELMPQLIISLKKDTMLSYVGREKKAAILDAKLHRALKDNFLLSSKLESTNILGAPLSLHDEVSGAFLAVRDKDQSVFTESEMRVLSAFSRALADVLHESKRG